MAGGVASAQAADALAPARERFRASRSPIQVVRCARRWFHLRPPGQRTWRKIGRAITGGLPEGGSHDFTKAVLRVDRCRRETLCSTASDVGFRNADHPPRLARPPRIEGHELGSGYVGGKGRVTHRSVGAHLTHGVEAGRGSEADSIALSVTISQPASISLSMTASMGSCRGLRETHFARSVAAAR